MASEKVDKRLWTGSCWLCGKQCFEVLDTYPRDHPLAGQPKSIGKPNHPTAKRVTLVRLRSGKTSDIVLCGACEPTPDRMSELNNVLNLRYRIDDSPWWREATGKEQKARESYHQRLIRLKTNVLYHSDPVLGEIARRPLAEVF